MAYHIYVSARYIVPKIIHSYFDFLIENLYMEFVMKQLVHFAKRFSYNAVSKKHASMITNQLSLE